MSEVSSNNGKIARIFEDLNCLFSLHGVKGCEEKYTLKNNVSTRKTISGAGIFLTTAIVIGIYLGSEWLFLVTMPSYLDRLGFLDKMFVLLYAIAFIVVLVDILFLPLFVLENVRPNARLVSILRIIYTAIPTLILTSLILILVDNFTYTMFHFGIITSEGIIRVIYAIGFIIVAIILFRRVQLFAQKRSESWQTTTRPKRVINYALLFVLFVITVGIPLSSGSAFRSIKGVVENADSLKPNIFLLTADGLNAQRMSVYGYSRDTTPFLSSISDELMLMENNFTNANATSGSIISIYTGKYPANTRCLYPPDILNDKNAYQHLPGILQSLGYYNAQFSLGYYVDAYELNVRDGFNEANGRSSAGTGILTNYLPTNYSQFISSVINRLSTRLLHIFFVKDMENPYAQVTSKAEYDKDEDKIDNIIDLLENKEEPLFVHMHWLGTHGPKFSPSKQVFSSGVDLVNQEPWDFDLYDDSILDFDHAIETLYNELDARGILQKSIIIIGSDHGTKWSAIDRVPLIFIFPDGEFTDKKSQNSQNIDIAPTILDYMQIDKPDWMDGISLLDELNPDRPIISVSVGNTVVDSATGENIHVDSAPPFFQFGKVTIFLCEKWYQLDLTSFVWNEGTISPYISQCDSQQVIDQATALNYIITYFDKFGFDTDKLESLH